MPILEKLIDEEIVDKNMSVDDLINEYSKENEEINVKFGEV